MAADVWSLLRLMRLSGNARRLLVAAVLSALIIVARPASGAMGDAPTDRNADADQTADALLAMPASEPLAEISPYWGPAIQRWSPYIGALSESYGFHPDFIAAVIRHESGGDDQLVSWMGAVGLMGVMPNGPGLEWRPPSEALLLPATNLRWGMVILSNIVQQSGGDLYAALAAYNGGWHQVNSREPREYAARVLDSYARAVLMRNGISPDSASRWTLAVEIRNGNVPAEPMLVLGSRPLSDLRTYAGHTVYSAVDGDGRAYYVHGYAVPIGLTEVDAAPELPGSADQLEAPLRARLGEKAAKVAAGNPRVLLACLPGLERLRGRVQTRWYSPSDCPNWER